MNRNDREKIIWKHLLSGTMSQEEAVRRIADIWHNDSLNSEEEGYDMAAQDITLKIQECTPSSAKTVPDARVQGAWRDAGNIALNHIGKHKEHR